MSGPIASAAKKLPSSASVVIIGGGIIGVSTAWQMALRGIKNIVVLEQNTLTSGTTWHAAGLMSTIKGSKPVVQMTAYSQKLYTSKEFMDEGGSLCGFHSTGSLLVSRDEDTRRMLQHVKQIGKYLGKNHRFVTAKDIEEIHPFVNTEGIAGGLYSDVPTEGVVNPADVTMHMASLAKKLGVKIYENVEVTGFGKDPSKLKLSSVETSQGTVDCDKCLVAAGAWTKQLVQEMTGKDLIPTAGVPHQYAVFEPIDGVHYGLPVVRDFKHKFYLKPEVGTFALGIFEGDPYKNLPDAVVERNKIGRVEREACNELFEGSLEKFSPWIDEILDVVPALASSGIKSWVHGPDCHSIDHGAILGKIWGLDNVFVACGFNSQGIQCGPGAGVALTEWMFDGYPHSLGPDFTALDVLRFHPEVGKDHKYCELRATEQYGTNYQCHFPGEQSESARPHRTLVAHDEHFRAGAVFGESFGWERPLYYLTPEELQMVGERSNARHTIWRNRSKDIRTPQRYSFDIKDTEWFEAQKRESLNCRNNAVLFDLSTFGKLKIQGPSAKDVLQGICTNDMDKENGSLIYSLMCNTSGGVLADFTVAKNSDDSFYLVSLSSQPYLIHDHICKYVTANEPELMNDASKFSVQNVTEDMCCYAIMGPKSRDILSQIVGSDNLRNEVFKPYSHQMIRLGATGVSCHALRVSFAGEMGWELHVPKDDALIVYKELFNAASNAGISLANAGTNALMNSLRLEKKFIHYGHEVSPLETPLDVGLGYVCKLNSSIDFVGKSALLKQKSEGIKKQLVTVSVPKELADKVSLWGSSSEMIYRNGEKVGYVTSGGYSHVTDQPIGLAVVSKFPIANSKDTYEVDFVTKKDGVQKFPVHLSSKCHVDQEGVRMLGGSERMKQVSNI
eukprot:Nk52_evm19s2506 gene=Nk52_evmTU19s2506